MIEQTIQKLVSLRLPHMASEYRRQTETGIMAELDFDERMAMVTDAECDARSNRKLQKLIRDAALSVPAARLTDLDCDPRRKLDKALIARLTDCQWIRQGRDLIITGACGTGKTWVSSAFGAEACLKTMTVKSWRAPALLAELAAYRGTARWTAILSMLKKPHLLIIDDFGMEPFDVLASRDLFEVVESRHRARSMIFNAQLPVSEWHGLFEDATIADAVMDRLVNNSYRIELSGPSLRGRWAKEMEGGGGYALTDALRR